MRRSPARRALAAAAVTASLALVSGCGSDDEAAAAPESTPTSTQTSAGTAGAVDVVLRDTAGTEVGTVTLTPEDGAVRVEGRFGDLPRAGYHGFHIHQKPVCDPKAADGPFSTAGPHFNPAGTRHGDHAGDLPPLLVVEEGGTHVIARTDRFTIEELRAGGAALIVHAQPDNLAHIPDRYQASGAPSPGPDEKTSATGDAGDRIACGVIEKA